MGVSSKSSKTKSNETATTTPQIPAFAMPAIQNYYNQTNDFIGGNMADYTTPATPIQQMAFSQAQDLRDPGQGYDLAAAAANSVRQSGRADLRAPDAPDVANVQLGQLGGPAYAQNPDAPDLAYLGDPSAYNVDPAQIAATQQAGGSQASGFMQNYMDPYLEDVVDASLAEYDDQAGRTQAQYAAQGAMNGAFGGSRFGIGEAQLLSDTDRKRALTDAGLRSDAYRFAGEMAQGDASRGTQASIANAQIDSNRALQQAMLEQQAGLYNSGLNSEYDLARFTGQNNLNSMIYGTQAANNQFNAGASNQFSLADFGAQNAAASQDAQAANAMASQVYGTEADMTVANAADQGAYLDRRLAAGGLLANIEGAQSQDQINRNNQLLTLGGTQYGINAQNSPLNQLLIGSGLLNPGGALNTVTGQQINSQGTSTTKQSGGLMGGLLGALSLATPFIPGYKG